MPESKARKTVAVMLSVGLGLLVALVMLFPIGGNFGPAKDTGIRTFPFGLPPESVRYYWSLGSIFLLGPITGGLLEHLNTGSILVGLALSILAGVLPYQLVMRRVRQRLPNLVVKLGDS